MYYYIIYIWAKYSRMNKVDPYLCLSRPHPFKFFKDCLPQILLGPFLNTWTQIFKYS